MKIENLKVGSVLSETSFYTVVKVDKNSVSVKDDNGTDIEISKQYVETILNSADNFSKEEKYTKTQLAELLISSPRIALTVAYTKQDTVKPAKQYKAEKEAAIQAVQNAKVSDVADLLNNIIENPISKVIPGELRVMKGRHNGSVDDLGRISFIDMEAEKGTNTHDARVRLVDPRTISYVIVNDVKYSLK